MRPLPPFIRRAGLLLSAGLIASLSCGREVTAPDAGRLVARGFSFNARFGPEGLADGVAGQLVPFDRVRITIRNDRSEIVVDRVIDFPSNATEVPVSLSVPLSFGAPATGEAMTLALAYVNAAGDTVFTGGPLPITVVPTSAGEEPPPPVDVPVVYRGTGSTAAGVVISPNGQTVLAGDPFTFTAVALDGQAAPIANTPIGWSSLDPLLATITAPGAGVGAALPARGVARIEAMLLNDKADTVLLTILPKAASLTIFSGNNQTAQALQALAQPIVVKVTATDGLGIAGVTVNFSTTSGGSFGTPSVVTDANGLAQTTWTLGATAGGQGALATSVGVPGSPVGFTGTATSPAATLIHHYPMNGNMNDAVGTVNGLEQGGVSYTASAVSFNGTTGYAEFPSQIVPTTGSYSVSLFVRNRTPLTQFAQYISQGTASAPGFYIGQSNTGVIRAGDTWINTGEPAPGNDGIYHHVVLVVDPSVPASRLFVDGTLRQVFSSPVTAPLTGTNTRLGRQFGAVTEYFNGDMDDVKIFTGALTTAQVTTLYNSGPTTAGILAFNVQPSAVVAGTAIAPAIVVRVQDALGRLQTGYNGTVSLTMQSNPQGASLLGTTSVNAVAGIATFSNISLDKVTGGSTLAAQATGYEFVESVVITVTAGAATQLVFTTQPTDATAGVAITPPIVVRARDAFANTATSFNGLVTLGFQNNPGGAAFGGTSAVSAVAGVATFSNVSISQPGTGYTLNASSGALSQPTSASFNIGASGPTVNAWTNAAGGNWSTIGNWSQGRVPNATDSVVIALNGTYSVTLDVNFTGRSVVVGGGTGTQTLALPSTRTISLNGALATLATGAITATSASIGGSAAVVNAGTLTLNSSNVAVPVVNIGLLIGQGNVSITGPFTALSTGILRSQGSSAFTTANVTIANGFTNDGTIELTSVGTGYASQLTVTTGTLTNGAGGQISSLAGVGGARTIAAQVVNTGTIALLTDLVLSKASAAHTNSGLVSATTGDLTVTQSGTSPTFTNTGTMTFSTNRLFNVSGGTLDLSAGVVNGRLATLATSTTTLLLTTSTAKIRLSIGATTTIPGTITIPVGDTLHFVAGTMNAPVVTNGVFIVESAPILAGALTLNAGGKLVVRGSSSYAVGAFTVANGFTNDGTIDLTSVGTGYGSSLTVGAGTLLNSAGGTILASTGVGGARTLAAALNNQGAISVITDLTLAKADAAHLNSGTITATTGDFTVTQSGTSPSFTNTGTMTFSANRVFSVSGGTLDLTAGLLNARTATLSTSTTTLLFTTATAKSRFSIGTTTTIPGTVTIPVNDTLHFVAGTMNAPVVTNGVLLIESTPILASALTLNAGGKLVVRGSSNYSVGAFTVANGFTNDGTIDLTSIGTGYGSSLTVGAGTLLNSSIGQIFASAGVGGVRTLAAQLDNQGTITVVADLTLAKASAAHLNSGTITQTTGDLTITQSGTAPTFTNTGTITVPANRVVTVSGGAFDFTSGILNGRGATFVSSSTTLSFLTSTLKSRLSIGTTTTIPGTITIPANDTLHFVAGTMNSPVVVDAGGVYLIESAPTHAAALTLNSGGKLVVRGSSAYSTGQLTVANGFTNDGIIDLTSVGTGYPSNLAVTAGTLLNSSIGQIFASAGVGGVRTLAAQLDNQGTITVVADLTLAKASAAHLNSGTITQTTGDLTITQSGTAPTFTNTGTITVSASRVVTVSGGAVDFTAGILNGRTATFVSSNTTLSFLTSTLKSRLSIGTTTTIPGTITIPANDTLHFVAGTMNTPVVVDAGGVYLVESTPSHAAALTLNSGGKLVVRGSSAYSTGQLTVANGFTNDGIIDLTSVGTGYPSNLVVTAGTLLNSSIGQIFASAGVGGVRTLAAQLDNQGSITVVADLTLAKASAAHLNSGTITSTTGDLTITQSGTSPTFTNTGTITVPANRIVTVNGGAADFTAGVLNGRAATFVSSTTTLSFLTSTLKSRLSIGTTTTIPGTITIPANDTLHFVAGTMNSPVVVDAGGVYLIESTPTLAAALTLNSGGKLVIRGSSPYSTGQLTVANGFTNDGIIDLTSVGTGYPSNLVVTAGTLLNSSIGQIFASAGVGGVRTLAAQLDNQGSITVVGDLTLAKASAAHLNSGTITQTTGDLTITQSGTSPTFTNTGTITVPSARVVTVSGGTFDFTSGILNGRGATFVSSNTTLNFTTSTLKSKMSLGTTTSIPGTFTIPPNDTLHFVAGTFNSPIVTDGVFLVESAPTMAAALTVNPTGKLLVRGSSQYANGVLTVANGFTNDGTIELTSVGTGYPATLNVTNGTLLNPAAGQILISVGVGGVRTIGAQLDNQGTIAATADLILAKASAAHLNSGSITMTGADLTITQSGTSPTFTNTGTITLSANRVINASGGTFNFAAGLVDARTSRFLPGTTTVNFAPATFKVRWNVGSAVVVPVPVALAGNDTLYLVGGAFPAAVTINGVLLAESSASLAGALAVNGGGKLVVRGSSTYGNGLFTVSNGFTNSGTIELTSFGTGYNSALNVTTGTLTIAASGSIQANSGVGGARTIGAPVTNSGALTVANGTTLTVTGLLQFLDGSSGFVGTGGSLVKSGGCSVTGVPTFTNMTCP